MSCLCSCRRFRQWHPPGPKSVTHASLSDPPQPSASAGSITDRALRHFSKPEFALLVATAVLLFVLRVGYAWTLVWSSDEPQHLHIVWAWVNGLLPYRDVFDNHSPLFSLLCSPFLALVGERANPITPMRLLLIPLWFSSAWCIYKIGSRCFSVRVGVWAALLSSLVPKYYFLIAQFRTDVLWTALWLAALAILFCGRLTVPRVFCAALVLGAAFAVSMKTTLLLMTLLVTGGIVLLTRRRFGAVGPLAWRQGMAGALTAVAGLLIVPSLLVAWFAAHGALGPMWYCVIQHNAMPGENTGAKIAERLWTHSGIFYAGFIAWFALAKSPAGTAPDVAVRRMFLRVATLVFAGLLNGIWPIVSDQDYIPWWPLLGLVVAPAWLIGVDWIGARRQSIAIALELLLIAGGIAWLTHRYNPIKLRNQVAHDRIAQVLALTRPGEFVMDGKGEFVYRQRAWYYALETLTLRRLDAHLIQDDIVERLIATRTAVINESGRLTPTARKFVHENYLHAWHVEVPGKQFDVPDTGTVSFDIILPETYSVISPDGPLAGTLDGTPIDGPRLLEAGPHTLQVAPGIHNAAIFWSRAATQGLTPYPVK